MTINENVKGLGFQLTRYYFDQFDDPDKEKVEGHNVDEEQVAGARLRTSAEDLLQVVHGVCDRVMVGDII